LLSVIGRLELLARPAIGVVGARNASAAGQRFAREMAWDLGRRGYLVVSGLARGIDAAAHGGALETGTAAVVGGGAAVVYPAENRALHEDIAARGAIVAEMPWGTVPQARHFPRRNRLISGMSAGVLVVEAALRSGSLITARLAAEQGREVFAVPGSPLDPRCRGTNDLIRNGAVLTETAEDVTAALGRTPGLVVGEPRRTRFAGPTVEPPDPTELDSATHAILELLGPTPVEADDIVRSAGFPLGTVSLVLLELELSGRIERLAGGRITRR
jgi:DNA processing protein